MPKYRTRPVIVDAVQWTGENWPEIEAFTDGHVQRAPRSPILRLGSEGSIEITTREGIASAETGDWIVRSDDGALYRCTPDIFASLYDAV